MNRKKETRCQKHIRTVAVNYRTSAGLDSRRNTGRDLSALAQVNPPPHW